MAKCTGGFHTSCHLSTEDGLFFGTVDGAGNVKCTAYLMSFSFKLFFIDGVPHIDYTYGGVHDRRSFSELIPSLSEKGLYATTREKRLIFNWFMSLFESQRPDIPELQDYVGFTEQDDGTLHVVGYNDSTYSLSGPLPDLPRVESRKLFLQLFDSTADKLGFIISMCYGLVSPLAKIVKSRNLFFPNLILLGEPETGKSALIRFSCSTIWGIKDNVKVSGDFDSRLAALKNLTGRGPAVVMNDLDQENFDRLKRSILSASDETHGGSRGQRDLGLAQLEVERSFALSSNYIRLGTQEIVDRFFVYKVRSFENRNGMEQKAESWNSISSKLVGIAYDILSEYEGYDVEDLLNEYFRGNRENTKNSIIRLGMRMIHLWLSRVFFNPVPLSFDHFQYEENLGEDYISIFYSWVEQQYDEIKRKALKDAAYANSNLEKIVNQYIMMSPRGDHYFVFPGAYDEFIHRHPNFPFKSPTQLAKRYPYVKHEPRYYSLSDGSKQSRRILVLPLEHTTDEEYVEIRTWVDDIKDAMVAGLKETLATMRGATGDNDGSGNVDKTSSGVAP